MRPPVKRMEIAGILRREICSGRYANCNRLPVEPELALRLGVTRKTLRSALDLLEKDVATPADIDRAVKYAVGMRYASIGLLEYFDAVGVELERAIAENVYPTLCNTDKIQKIVSDGIRDGRTGQKAGEGLYRWDEDSLADFRVRLQEPFLKSVENWSARK